MMLSPIRTSSRSGLVRMGPLDFQLELKNDVDPSGFEPEISAMSRQCHSQLDHGSVSGCGELVGLNKCVGFPLSLAKHFKTLTVGAPMVKPKNKCKRCNRARLLNYAELCKRCASLDVEAASKK